MNIVIGSDHAGYEMKKIIKEWLKEDGYGLEDIGVDSTDSVDYPDIAKEVCNEVVDNKGEIGILICGTGIGMAIAANKVSGIRAANCQEPYSSQQARKHNKANVLTLGARVIGINLVKAIITSFLEGEFDGGRHQRRVNKVMDIEK